MIFHHNLAFIVALSAAVSCFLPPLSSSSSLLVDALSFYRGGSAVLSARVCPPPPLPSKSAKSKLISSTNDTDDKKDEEKEGLKLHAVSFYHFTPIHDVISTRNELWKALVTLGRRHDQHDDDSDEEANSDDMDWITPFSSTASSSSGTEIGGHNRPLLDYDSPRGTIYVAPEGINGQLALTPQLAFHLEDALKSVEPFQSIAERKGTGEKEFELNWGETIYINPYTADDEKSSKQPFRRLLVRARNQILTDNLPQDVHLDLNDRGIELTPEEWHEQLQQQQQQDNVVARTNEPPIILDCRNTYESDEGIFQNAIPLDTQTFGDTWDALKEKIFSSSLPLSSDVTNEPQQQSQEQQQPPVYIYCTGGIRCVKVGAYLKQELGIKDVRSLRHGIVGYERWISDQEEKQQHHQGSGASYEAECNKVESLWLGKNYHFDQRNRRDQKELVEQKEKTP